MNVERTTKRQYYIKVTRPAPGEWWWCEWNRGFSHERGGSWNEEGMALEMVENLKLQFPEFGFKVVAYDLIVTKEVVEVSADEPVEVIYDHPQR